MNLKNYIAELKRRNVFKASAAYLIVAWLVVQVASIVLPAFEAPPYVMKVLLFLLGIGFPINLVNTFCILLREFSIWCLGVCQP